MRWYVVHTKPNQEQRALANLRYQSYNAWLPMIQIEKVRRSRVVHVTEPMFSRYLFVQLDQVNSNWMPIRSTLGVNGLVGFGQSPVAVPEGFVEQLQAAPQADVERLFKPSDGVKFVDGPLKGLQGIFSKINGNQRAIVLIQLLGQPQSVQVPVVDLIPVI
jgi:transcriptional antiterminator RfaH